MEVERASFNLWSPRRRPWSTVLDAQDSSSNRRTRFRLSRPTSPPPPPPASRRSIIFDDDDLDRSEADDDGIHGQDDDADGDQEVDEDYVGLVQSERETEYDPLENVSTMYEGGEDEPQPLVEDSDDDMPIRFVRRGGERPAQQPVEEEDSDDDRPILSRSRSRTVVRPGHTAPAPAPAPAVAPAMAPPAPPERPPSSSSDSASSVIQDATVAKINGADCGICYLPLKPPIFQCGAGHVVCSRCSERMGQATNCHKCRAPMPDGYRWCHDMEQLVDSIHVPCPHAAHGCAARPVYHGRDAHARACRHAPCHCPAESCGFSGSTAALADHLAAAHRWPCTTTDSLDVEDGGFFSIPFRDGFNFVTGGNRFLLLLNVEKAPPLGRAVGVLRSP
ncbi:unnamed protein product [Urochloa humidicola]